MTTVTEVIEFLKTQPQEAEVEVLNSKGYHSALDLDKLVVLDFRKLPPPSFTITDVKPRCFIQLNAKESMR
jgi:RNase adaptor protein for sRNA GlmZ degradation